MNLDYKTGYGISIISLILIIILVLVNIEYDHQSTLMCELVAEDPEREMFDCPTHQSNIPWLITAGFVMLSLLLMFGIYIIYNDKKSKGYLVDISKLNEEEKKVVEILKNNNGSCYQSDIVKELNWSKVKTTRVLDKLENKDIIDKRRRGMTNLVILK